MHVWLGCKRTLRSPISKLPSLLHDIPNLGRARLHEQAALWHQDLDSF
jgi:hypothetical protein